MICYQIADLHLMTQTGQVNDPNAFSGIDSPTGHRWYNFDPSSYLLISTQFSKPVRLNRTFPLYGHKNLYWHNIVQEQEKKEMDTALLFDVSLALETLGHRQGDHPFLGTWEEKHWMSTPGPIYCGGTDNCGTGPVAAPNNVELDERGDSRRWRLC